MLSLPNIKQGNTFYYYVQWPNAQLNELKSQVRDSAGRLISDVLIQNTTTEYTFKLIVENTSEWPIKVLLTDIQRTVNGIVESSPTYSITVLKGVTV